MRHEALTNHIKGSFLKEQYLEAFLVQSAYIENLLKVFANYSFFVETKATHGSATAVAVARRIEKFNLTELIEFLHESKLIDIDQKNSLEQYQKQRNKIMHDLLKEIRRDEFDREVKVVCEKGAALIESKQFKEMANLVESLDDDAATVAQPQPLSPQPTLAKL